MFLFKQLFCIAGIVAANLYINEKQIFLFFFYRFPYILGIAGIGIKASSSQHTAHLIFRILLMGGLCCQSACYQHMMGSLVNDLVPVSIFFKGNSCAGKRTVKDDVDFVKRKPVFYKTGKFLKTGFGISEKTVYHIPASPGAVFGNQTCRNVKMAQGNQRFHAIFAALFKHTFIKCNSFRIGMFFVSLGIKS